MEVDEGLEQLVCSKSEHNVQEGLVSEAEIELHQCSWARNQEREWFVEYTEKAKCGSMSQ